LQQDEKITETKRHTFCPLTVVPCFYQGNSDCELLLERKLQVGDAHWWHPGTLQRLANQAGETRQVGCVLQERY
jgi:hypothetical protein